MSANVSAYVEKFNEEKKEWDLATPNPISTRLNYILPDYNELPRLQHQDLSSELKSAFPVEESGQCYASFYTTTLEELEEKVNQDVRGIYSKLNVIIKAMGVHPIYTNDGEESAWYDEEGEKEKQ